MYMGYSTPLDMRLWDHGKRCRGSGDHGSRHSPDGAFLSRCHRVCFIPMTDAKTPDPQAVFEKHLQTYLCATAGVNYIMPSGWFG